MILRKSKVIPFPMREDIKLHESDKYLLPCFRCLSKEKLRICINPYEFTLSIMCLICGNGFECSGRPLVDILNDWNRFYTEKVS